MSSDQPEFMRRALELAGFGAGNTAPNPMVGCVIVARNQIIGEGFHARFGEAHAEVNAINAVKARELLTESTLYVTLEPCNHTGKTPPCTRLILECGIKNVIIATKDPNPLVAGNGVKFLEAAGITVSCGIMEQESIYLNRRFFTYHQEHRPYIILRWAESADGFCDPVRNGTERISIPVSGTISRQKSHQWRTEEQAILVGVGTVVQDDPALNPRMWPGSMPLRILFDPNLRAPTQSRLFTDGFPTLVFNTFIQEQRDHLQYIRVSHPAEMIAEMQQELFRRNILSVLVEGGPETIRRFMDAGAWDEVRRFRSNKMLGGGVPAPVFLEKADVYESSGEDRLEFLYRKKSDFIR